MAHGSTDSLRMVARLVAVGSLVISLSAVSEPTDRQHSQTKGAGDVVQPPATRWNERAFSSSFQYDIPDLQPELDRSHQLMLDRVRDEDAEGALSVLEPLGLRELPPSVQVAAMMTNEALLLLVLHRPEDAAISIDTALETMETTGEIAHPLLVTLLTVQGDIQRRAGAFDFATDSYHLAQGVDHKLNGVDSLSQLPLLEKLSATKLAEAQSIIAARKFAGMAQFSVMTEADAYQQQAMRISEKNHGKFSEAHTERIMQTGHYYMRRSRNLNLVTQSAAMDLLLYVDNSGCNDRGGDYQDGQTVNSPTAPPLTLRTLDPGFCVPAHTALRDVIQYQEYQKFLVRHQVDLYREASNLYKQSIDIISNIHGPDDVRLFEPYQHLAHVMYLRGKKALGLRYLNRSLETVVNDVGTDRLDKITALINVGDFFNYRESVRSRHYYMRALAIINEQPDAAQLREQFFGKPVVVRNHVRTIRLTNPPKGETPYLHATFRVTRTGEVDQVRVSDGNVRFAARQQVKKYLQTSRFRPRVDDGTLVDTGGVTHDARFTTRTSQMQNALSRVGS